MAARKCKMQVCAKCGQTSPAGGRPSYGACLEGCFSLETVTAYDSRDVDPLLEAATALLRSRCDRLAREDDLANALAPFDSEEKT
jgi:hypothetical protein